MTNVLVLGTSGMLGSMVFDYLSKNKTLNVYGTVRNKEFQKEKTIILDAERSEQLEQKQITDLKIEYIINCIGITKPFCKDDDVAGVIRAIKVNSMFPWDLAKFAKKCNIKVLQIGTDCVYSGKTGKYIEGEAHDALDVYGKSKSLGEVFDGSTLIIRSSIIGPEIKGQNSFLLAWFLNQPIGGTIGGFEHHVWNGVTTLQFAQLCEKIILTNSFDKLVKISKVHHFVPNNIVNKFELMHIFDDVYQRKLVINKINKPNEKLDRSLGTKYNALSELYPSHDLKSAMQELKIYINNSTIYKPI
jgi:dTDP-4-dehydrorhamnose reductase